MPAAKLPVADFRTQADWHAYLGKLTATQLKKVATALNKILRTEFRLNTKKPAAELIEDVKKLYSVNNNSKLLEIVKGISADELPQPSQNLPKPTKKQAAAAKEAEKARVKLEEEAKQAEIKKKAQEAQEAAEMAYLKRIQERNRQAEIKKKEEEEERREAALKSEAQKMKSEQQKMKTVKQQEYSIVIEPPKEGETGYVSNFSKLTPIEQLDIVMRSATITGKPPNPDFYQTIAGDFYTNINNILNKSPYTAVKELVNKYKFTPEVLRLIYKAKTESDFYPTGEKAVDIFIDRDRMFLKNGWQGRNARVKLLEGTSGIGSVAYWFSQSFPDLLITLNELDKNNLELSKLLLGNKFKYQNEDFFKLGTLRFPYDIIFLNPPFLKNQGYIKFVLQAIKYLNGGDSPGRLYLICPQLTEKSMTGSVLDWVKGDISKYVGDEEDNLDGGRILANRFFNIADEISSGDREDNVENWLRPFEINYCEKLGTTSDFGGTKTNADLYFITTK